MALHEFGHSLGLFHTSEEGAIMLPYYFAVDYHVQLHPDDVAGIQSLYGEFSLEFWNQKLQSDSLCSTNVPGSRSVDRVPLPTMAPTTQLPRGVTTPKRQPVEVPNACDMSYDAITIITNSVFIFRKKVSRHLVIFNTLFNGI